jgi:hypothetical protein
MKTDVFEKYLAKFCLLKLMVLIVKSICGNINVERKSNYDSFANDRRDYVVRAYLNISIKVIFGLFNKVN